MHDFCRLNLKLHMETIKGHTTAAQRKATWAYKFRVGQGRRPTFEWNGPDGYRWEGKADCLWDAKVKGWSSWMEDVITPTISCELCGDERSEEDLNEDGRCLPCEEREEKNENGI
jgi:hypothetical protein